MEFYDLKQQRLAVLLGEMEVESGSEEGGGRRRWLQTSASDPLGPLS